MEIPQCLRLALKLEASFGGEGFIMERIKARQSATFLFGAQDRAGVHPAETTTTDTVKHVESRHVEREESDAVSDRTFCIYSHYSGTSAE